jgi:hypothetical protein
MKETRLLMENQAEPSVAGMTKEKAWNYAIGIVQVDGIKPSDDFLELVEKEKKGLLTSEDIQRVLLKKYTMIEDPGNA